jgi:MYXO-CTERM domain-containing protein
LAISALGLFTVPLALLFAVVLVARRHTGRPALGVLVGMAVVSLWVAYVQRRGPGTVSWHTGTASGATQYLDPRPWLVVGVLLVGVGLAAFLRRRRPA